MGLIGLSGKARSGKDTLADECLKQFGWERLSLATALKNKAMKDFDLDVTQAYGESKDIVDVRYGVTPRKILIEMGQFYRSIDPNYWLKQLAVILQHYADRKDATFVITDVRFKNEADWVKEHGGFMVRLHRPIEMRGFELDDRSETELDDYERFDLIIPESRNVNMADVPTLAQWVNERFKAFCG